MSDEADRRRAYRELEERGQPVPGKFFGKRMPPMKQKETPKIKVIDTTKMKQLKLLKTGGKVDPLKGLSKMVSDFGKGKTGIKTVDMQKKKDAALTKNLKKMAKTSRVKAKPQTFDITPKPGSALSIQKETITMAKDGGLMEAIEKVKAKEMKEGGNVPKPKMRPKKDQFRADKTVIINEDFSKAVAKANEEAMKKAKKMEEGGPVPAKFKGFSKLPEAVQEKMNPTLAKKFGEGGSVKSKMMCRGRGAAIKGGGFSIR
tara:strand:- start:546 stop:1322 length:777 start_codon:yes stop_codon:yes gene_type:complete